MPNQRVSRWNSRFPNLVWFVLFSGFNLEKQASMTRVHSNTQLTVDISFLGSITERNAPRTTKRELAINQFLSKHNLS